MQRLVVVYMSNCLRLAAFSDWLYKTTMSDNASDAWYDTIVSKLARTTHTWRVDVLGCARLADKHTLSSSVYDAVFNLVTQNPLITDAELVKHLFKQLERQVPPQLRPDTTVSVQRLEWLSGCFHTWLDTVPHEAQQTCLFNLYTVLTNMNSATTTTPWYAVLRTALAECVIDQTTDMETLCANLAHTWLTRTYDTVNWLPTTTDGVETTRSILDTFDNIALVADPTGTPDATPSASDMQSISANLRVVQCVRLFVVTMKLKTQYATARNDFNWCKLFQLKVREPDNMRSLHVFATECALIVANYKHEKNVFEWRSSILLCAKHLAKHITQNRVYHNKHALLVDAIKNNPLLSNMELLDVYFRDIQSIPTSLTDTERCVSLLRVNTLAGCAGYWLSLHQSSDQDRLLRTVLRTNTCLCPERFYNAQQGSVKQF